MKPDPERREMMLLGKKGRKMWVHGLSLLAIFIVLAEGSRY